MTADVLEVALEFGRELCAKNETTKAKVVSALIAEVKEHRAKAEAPVDLEPLKVAIVTLGDAPKVTTAPVIEQSFEPDDRPSEPARAPKAGKANKVLSRRWGE